MSRNNDLSSMMEALHVLKMTRRELVYDFNNRKHEIYRPMYKYESHPELMNLAIESYFTSWVNSHFTAWHKHYPDKPGKLFYQVIRCLLLNYSDISEIGPRNHSLVTKIISSKIQLIDDIIKSGEKDNEKYCSLLLEYEKDKTLFEREINRLKGDSL